MQHWKRTTEIAGKATKANLLYISGDKGLNVIAKGSYHAEILDQLSNNLAVVDQPSSKGTGNEVDMEQILKWNPDVILFAPGSDVIDARSLPILRQVAAVLKSRPGIARVRIEGHTDDRGDREMNVDLSERRARQVRNVLIEAGVAPVRLEARGYGPVRPVGDNATAEGRARNRRVEFRVLGPGEGGEEAP